MTTPRERTSAIQRAREFMYKLLDKTLTPRVPMSVREDAQRVLRHYPEDWVLETLAKAEHASGASFRTIEHPDKEEYSPPEHYILRLTPNQAQALVNACDFYSRIGIGQFGEVAHLARCGMINQKKGVDRHGTAYETAEYYLNEAKRALTGLESNSNYGIASDSVNEEFKVTWDLQQVIRHRLAWDRRGNPATREWRGENSMMGTHYDDPHKTSKEPIAAMERASDADMLEDLPYGYALARMPDGSKNIDKWYLLDCRNDRWVTGGESVLSMLNKAKELANEPRT